MGHLQTFLSGAPTPVQARSGVLGASPGERTQRSGYFTR